MLRLAMAFVIGFTLMWGVLGTRESISKKGFPNELAQ
jgi:hypothetical protein